MCTRVTHAPLCPTHTHLHPCTVQLGVSLPEVQIGYSLTVRTEALVGAAATPTVVSPIINLAKVGGAQEMMVSCSCIHHVLWPTVPRHDDACRPCVDTVCGGAAQTQGQQFVQTSNLATGHY